ncbi:MAG: hypothetical protein ACWGQW_02685 [bacterium]
MSSEIISQLETLGQKILEGHKDIELDSSEVNLIWELEVSELTKPLRAVIIENLRQNRKTFAQKKAQGRGKKKATPLPQGGIDLSDLDLDLKL